MDASIFFRGMFSELCRKAPINCDCTFTSVLILDSCAAAGRFSGFGSRVDLYIEPRLF